MMETLSGVVDNVIFANAEGSFSVFKLQPERDKRLVTVTVNFPAPLVGQELEMQGEWITHPRFGEQFRASSIRVSAPTSAKGIERFLASGAIKGIGADKARKIVSVFGKDSLRIIEYHPERLLEVPGIGKKTASKIAESYREQSELKEIMLFLETNGVSGTYAGRIFKKYGSFSIDVMTKNPYRLAYDVQGIGFLTADAIARGIDGDMLSPNRILAGIDYALSKVASFGHCCVPERMIIKEASQLLSVEADMVADVLKEGLEREYFSSEVVAGEHLIYPRYLYWAEKGVAERLLFLNENADTLFVGESDFLVRKWEENVGVLLADGQREAVKATLLHGVFVLTGGPGTGKTTVVRAMLDIFDGLGLVTLLGAPTGRAAKRLSEATGRKAQTVHRLLEAQGGEGDDSIFGRDEDTPLEADVIILDEVSMMDTLLMYNLLVAVPDGAHVILVGDADQLPSVGAGTVLKDILRSDALESVRLTEIFRQAQESAIIRNAHAINAGRMPFYVAGSDFEFLRTTSAEETEALILKLCQDILPKQGFDALTDVQVLSPMHMQICGIDSLNRLLQRNLNPLEQQNEWRLPSLVFREGDKVMQIKNNYTKGVFNGDIGFIEYITEDILIVKYGEELVEYEKKEINELVLSYAMSVHKSQGSEYPVVILPLVPAHHIMLQRNLLYTAVTRAKEKVILLGSLSALRTAVENDKTRKRFTLLAERLNHALE